MTGDNNNHHHGQRQAYQRASAAASPSPLPPLAPPPLPPSRPLLPPLAPAPSPDAQNGGALSTGRRRRSSSGVGGGGSRRRHSDAGGGGGSSSSAAAAAAASARRRRQRHAFALALSAACSALAVLLFGWLLSSSPSSVGSVGGPGPVRRHDASWATSYFGGNPALRLLGAYWGGGGGGGGRGSALGRRAGVGRGAGAPVPGHGAPGVDALVLYAYAGHADPEAPANLRYFLREAVAGDRAAHYLLAVELPPGHPARLSAEAAQQRRRRRPREEEEGEEGGEGRARAGEGEDPAAAERRRRGMRGPLAGLVVVPETPAGGADGVSHNATAASAAAVSPRALGLPALPHVRRPHLPHNARYVFHAGGCYDMGMWAHLLLGGEVEEGDGRQGGGGGGDRAGDEEEEEGEEGGSSSNGGGTTNDNNKKRKRPRRSRALKPTRRLVPDWRRYRLFLFINSSVRGPFLPSYARGRLHWTDPFSSRLGGPGDVRLVGPTVSCEGTPLGGNASGGDWRRNPHVQTYAWAVGQTGLADLLAEGTVLRCHASRWDAIYFGELGASAAVLRAGGNLAAMMARYQGVDWRVEQRRQRRREEEGGEGGAGSGKKKGAGGEGAGEGGGGGGGGGGACNAGATPLFEFSNDGVGVDPLEVVFVKVKRGHVSEGSYGVGSVSAAHRALAYDRWQAEADADAEAAAAAPAAAALSPLAPPPLSARRAESLAANAYASELPRFRAPRVLEARARGAACFDADAYARWNGDLAPLAAAAAASSSSSGGGGGGASAEEARRGALWRHYVYFGQFETGRRYRFTCPMDYEKLARAPGDAPA